MANSILTLRHGTSQSLYIVIEDLDGQVYDIPGDNFEAQDNAQWGNYDTPATEVSESSQYTATIPAGLSAGFYRVRWFQQQLSGILPSDTNVHSEYIRWDGTAIVPPEDDVDGLPRKVYDQAQLAWIAGKSSVVDNPDGTKTITYNKQDGATGKLKITFNTQGEFISTQIL